MHPIFSFIIVNFQSAALLPGWFASLETTSLTPDEYEVIIVNNDITEKEILDALAQQLPFTIIHTKNNLGFGAACNIGAANASGEILGFINPDTQFVSGDLRSIRDRFQSESSIGIIGLKLLTQSGSIQKWSAGTRGTLWDVLRNNFGFPASKKLWQSQIPIAVDWVSGASLFIPRDFFRKIKGFDETFFLYFEDIDLCDRVLAQGKSVLYFPDMALMHISGHSAPSHKQQKQYYYASQDRYFAKHRPRWESRCLKILRTLFSH